MPKSPAKPTDPADAPALPVWFDPARHLWTPAGIVEADGHALLDENGDPRSAALRAYRQHQAATAAATEPQE